MAKRNNSGVKHFFSGIPVNRIIEEPLLAVIRAQSAMAQEQIILLLKICFDYNARKKVYKPKQLEMTLTRSILQPNKEINKPPELVQVTSTFQVPLLIIFPINSLGVENINIDFGVEITSQHALKIEDKQDEPLLFKKTSKAKLLGKIAASNLQKIEEVNDRTSSTLLNINVDAGTMPLPKGLLEIIDIYSKALHLDTVEVDK